ncbi:hypothetical protein Q760_13980 [Cellulomonas cellasea DSM 20118]|uniref:Uncharacterized protein n=1 Tax=Cellulomonas cellasea DSM 20118 TaxID=1408250 RepID=A0A0A0B842_9CELL|nr:hypothetical protein Q760_13980 [Cellulomonas cellasea DSM 20118]
MHTSSPRHGRERASAFVCGFPHGRGPGDGSTHGHGLGDGRAGQTHPARRVGPRIEVVWGDPGYG